MDVELTGEMNQTEKNGIIILSVTGYFDEKLGLKANSVADGFLRTGKVRFVIDLKDCKVINSPGLAQIVELSEKVVEDFKGRLFLAQPKPIFQRMFKMAGILPQAEEAPDLGSALVQIAAQRP